MSLSMSKTINTKQLQNNYKTITKQLQTITKQQKITTHKTITLN